MLITNPNDHRPLLVENQRELAKAKEAYANLSCELNAQYIRDCETTTEDYKLVVRDEAEQRTT